MTAGLSTFGVVRKRMADLIIDFALRIKEGGAFGAQTTVDNPDSFPGDPLVAIATTSAASDAELWEAVELWYAQLDPETATGIYLERMHGERVGIARATGQSDADYRAAILAAIRARPTRSDPETVAVQRPDIECARLLVSTLAAPIDGIPAPGAMLIVKGCNIDWQAFAADLYSYVELGAWSLYGSRGILYTPPSGGCIGYQVQEAIPVFAAIDIGIRRKSACGGPDLAMIKAAIVAMLQANFGTCGLGAGLSGTDLIAALGPIADAEITHVRFARRARQLIGSGCDTADLPAVTICGVSQPWASAETCGYEAGEVWCDPDAPCLSLRPWEYMAFDAQFVTVSEADRGLCA